MGDIRDTSKGSPAGMLGGAMVLGASGFVEQMEAQGQREVVASHYLPVSLGEMGSDTEADYEALGFKFGPVKEGDPIWREASLPEGWSRKGSDHDMWSYVVDGENMRRVAIFYKAAFYDRSCFMRLIDPPEATPEPSDG